MIQWLKSAAVAMTGVLLLSCPAMAGPKAPPKPPAVRPTAPHSANPLNLTLAQQDKLRALSAKMMPEIQKAMQSAKTDDVRRARFTAVQKKYDAQLMAILTPKQRGQLKAMRAQAEARMKSEHAGMMPKK